MKAKKYGCIICVILTALLGLSAILWNIFAEKAKGVYSQSGYMLNGTFYVTNSGMVGGNSEAVASFSDLRDLFIVGAVLFLLIAIVLGVQCLHLRRLKEDCQHGIVLEKNGKFILFEFDGGERKQYTLEPDVQIVKGDKGTVYAKGKYIVKFMQNDL